MSSHLEYSCFDIKCQWLLECTNKDCYIWRIQRAGAWYMCESNAMARALYELWEAVETPRVKMTHGSGGPCLYCSSFQEGNEEENNLLDAEIEKISKRLENNDLL